MSPTVKFGIDIITDEEGLNPQFCVTEYPAVKILDGEAVKERPNLPETICWLLLEETTWKYNRVSKGWERWYRWRVLGLDASGDIPLVIPFEPFLPMVVKNK